MLDRAAYCAEALGDKPEERASLLPLNVRGLTYEIAGVTLIDNVDLKLTSGAISMILGPNGAGKSVLLRLLHGLLPATAGEISWGEETCQEKIRRRQAMVFQKPVLLRRSVAANLDFVLGLRGKICPEERKKILDQVGLADRENQPARVLSGGEQQRLALARAVAIRPDILFLDEPTANLDPASVLMIEEIVKKLHDKGTKIIFVTHDIGQAKRLADEIIFMHGGNILEQSPAKSFLDDPATKCARDFLSGRIVL